MNFIAHIALVVHDYDEAIDFYVTKLGFTLVEDTPQPGKRWVTIRPAGAPSSGPGSTTLVLQKADSPDHQAVVGKQAGGRVFLFLETDDFARDYEKFDRAGVQWVREKVVQPYGTVAVFSDLYGNEWDLIERSGGDKKTTKKQVVEEQADR